LAAKELKKFAGLFERERNTKKSKQVKIGIWIFPFFFKIVTLTRLRGWR
jgi:hypothetical protein